MSELAKKWVRHSIQAAATLLQNANFKGFFEGRIYQGPAKSVCVPGLNCYSCPGAVGACPVGSLQTYLSGLKFKVPYYVVGILIFVGALIGRAVCGFLCPFGFLQDLLYKIPFFKKNEFKLDKYLRYFKYVVLGLFLYCSSPSASSSHPSSASTSARQAQLPASGLQQLINRLQGSSDRCSH